MALNINMKIKGITQNWYIKVTHTKAANKGISIATYGYFTDAAQAENINNAIDLQNISFVSTVGTDILAQSYLAIKSLPEFSTAVDC